MAGGGKLEDNALEEGGNALGPGANPLGTLSSLLALQDVEDHKPRLSKISWLPDILVLSGSIIPTVIGPVLSVTLWAGGVAVAALLYGKEVGLSNNVVPLLSVVVALLLVFRNSSAYERYAEGRKDFTALISNARNLSRVIWIAVSLPPASDKPGITRAQLTESKRRLIRLIVAFVVATKHHLRAEGGVHHDDLRGLLPAHLAGSPVKRPQRADPSMSSPIPISPNSHVHDEEAHIGSSSRPLLSPSPSHVSAQSHDSHPGKLRSALDHLRPTRAGLKRRPTNVRIVLPDGTDPDDDRAPLAQAHGRSRDHPPLHEVTASERTPLIKPGVTPDIRRTAEDVERSRDAVKQVEIGLGKMVELGLPLIIAHEMSRSIYRFRRMGCLEAVGPAGMNAMQSLVQSMTDQLGSMERMQTPLPVIFGVHLKQTVTLFLFILPFTLVDVMGWKMIVIVTCCAFTMMGVEHIAAQVEMPFGTDPCDLNLDLFCVELRCECEAILDRLPEGDDDDLDVYSRSEGQRILDNLAADDDGGDAAE